MKDGIKSTEEYMQQMQSDSSELVPPDILKHLTVEYEYNFEKRSILRPILFSYIKKHASDYIHNKMTDDELMAHIKQHYHEDQKANIDFFYNSIPESEFWRLFVDLRIQRDKSEKGWLGYENREPGSIQAMYDAFKFVQSTLNEDLTSTYISNIHKLAAAKCPSFTYRTLESLTWDARIKTVTQHVHPGKYRGNMGIQVRTDSSAITPLGLVKLVDSSLEITYPKEKQCFLIYPPFFKDNKAFKLKIASLIEDYNQSMQSDEPIDKLRAIVQFVQAIEWIHPYRDGNLRTLILLLNRELVRHGFTPTLLEDPNRFDGFTHDEMLFEVLRGMDSFESLRTKGMLPDCEATDSLKIQNGFSPIRM